MNQLGLAETRTARAVALLKDLPELQILEVNVDNEMARAIAYPQLCGRIEPGDSVLLNTTAVSLSLGTGGYHYIICRLPPEPLDIVDGGHIMKMRYTPFQVKVLSVEEEDSPYRDIMSGTEELEGTPVLTATLHSLVAPLAMVLHSQGITPAFVMTDGAALPVAFSDSLRWLKNDGLIAGTVSCGHAFGGDLEAVNVYSGLLAARKVLGAQVIIVAMGPGIVGTGTRWGFTGVEQGEIINAVSVLGGRPVAVPRISFSDSRVRHQGLSHHTLTALGRVCLVRAHLPLPRLPQEPLRHILDQAAAAGLFDRHLVCLEDGGEYLELFRQAPQPLKTMGRGVDQEPEFYSAAAACAITAAKLARGEEPAYLHRC